MTIKSSYKIALPWSLTHYIALNGFHPLYRALIEEAPSNLSFCAWDNVKLYHQFLDDPNSRKKVLSECRKYEARLRSTQDPVEKTHLQYYWPPNQVLTEQLEGDIEFHHTAPFPSLTRPFVFHCEMFDSIFLSFIILGMKAIDTCKEYLRSIFAHPLCIGISSHIPETLDNFRSFFSDPIIDQKLFLSQIGLSSSSLKKKGDLQKGNIETPQFLFVNSANQDPMNFFRRGGHIVLRFWKELIASGRKGILTLRCCKPSDHDLLRFGVDPVFIQAEIGSSITWMEGFASNDTLNSLMESAHFFLLPSEMLHSVSIMQAMSFGAIPVVTDTLGTFLYVPSEQYGIILKGVRDAWWHHDPDLGILRSKCYDSSRFNEALCDSLFHQLCQGVFKILDSPDIYRRLQEDVSAYAQQQFSGVNYSDHFWKKVSELYSDFLTDQSDRKSMQARALSYSLRDCHLNSQDWSRVFESATQPHARDHLTCSSIIEMGGIFIRIPRSQSMKNNDWSVMARYISFRAPPIHFASSPNDFDRNLSMLWIRRHGKRRISLSSMFSLFFSWTITILKRIGFAKLIWKVRLALAKIRKVLRPVRI